jgi:YD repeat-containing protein
MTIKGRGLNIAFTRNHNSAPSSTKADGPYDGAGRLLNRILSNGARTDYTWDYGNRLVTLTNTTGNGTIIDTSGCRPGGAIT